MEHINNGQNSEVRSFIKMSKKEGFKVISLLADAIGKAGSAKTVFKQPMKDMLQLLFLVTQEIESDEAKDLSIVTKWDNGEDLSYPDELFLGKSLVTAEGQLKVGDTIFIRVAKKKSEIKTTVKKIIQAYGCEEVIYDLKRNRFFITTKVLKGVSWAESVEIKR